MIKIKDINITNDYCLIIDFETNEKKVFDLKPYLNKPVFQQLNDINYFKLVRNKGYFIEWPNEEDLSSDTLYYEGKAV
jgi:hypothetical protein